MQLTLRAYMVMLSISYSLSLLFLLSGVAGGVAIPFSSGEHPKLPTHSAAAKKTIPFLACPPRPQLLHPTPPTPPLASADTPSSPPRPPHFSNIPTFSSEAPFVLSVGSDVSLLNTGTASPARLAHD